MSNNRKKEKERGKDHQAFEQLALADPYKVEEQTGVTRPSDESVQAAKDWVDFNKK